MLPQDISIESHFHVGIGIKLWSQYPRHLMSNHPETFKLSLSYLTSHIPKLQYKTGTSSQNYFPKLSTSIPIKIPTCKCTCLPWCIFRTLIPPILGSVDKSLSFQSWRTGKLSKLIWISLANPTIMYRAQKQATPSRKFKIIFQSRRCFTRMYQM